MPSKVILQNREFWHDVEQLKVIIGPAKCATKDLEFSTTTLSDCFLELIKLASEISKIPIQNADLKHSCIAIFNKRWSEFDIDIYMLAFFLNPKYRGGGKTSSDLLLVQLSLYRNFEEPFNEIYLDGINTPINWWTSLELKKNEDCIRVLALKLHSIVPHNGACERVFSVLGWYLGKRRTRINIERLQSIAQIHSYFVTNAKDELKYLNEEISVEELDETFNQIALSITNGNDLFGQDDNLEDISHLDNNCDEEVINLDGVNDSHLIITESIDLNSSLLSNNNILSNEIYEENDIDHGDTNFDIDELLDNHNFD
ncbi:14889_t:CDS:2 [Entrophospora sp. SA101]|nr:14889_t:CDS:2 [Entrophospora sp. SA101]